MAVHAATLRRSYITNKEVLAGRNIREDEAA
jgi:hypothetical protein